MEAHRHPTEDVTYHWFNHLLDEQGGMIDQRDGPSLLPAHWRAGDTVFNWFDLHLPSEPSSGDYGMRVGMYAYPAVQNVPLLDSGGAPGEEWIEIRPLQVAE